jgi:hypothetical protein
VAPPQAGELLAAERLAAERLAAERLAAERLTGESRAGEPGAEEPEAGELQPEPEPEDEPLAEQPRVAVRPDLESMLEEEGPADQALRPAGEPWAADGPADPEAA